MKSLILNESLFDAYLKCKSKFYLKLSGTVASDPEFSNYRQNLSCNYRVEALKELRQDFNRSDCFFGTPLLIDFKRNKYKFIINCALQSNGIKSHIHALEKIDTCASRRFTSYAPLRFITTERITKQDKLMLAFDGLAISGYLGKEPLLGKIIHGNKHSVIKVRLIELIESANEIINEIFGQQWELNPPATILNKNCSECEFHSQCYKTAAEKDDLSLLHGLSEKERIKLHKKGVFTVTQLSYTFRPRRRPKKDASKPIKYHHSLRALAIRDNKTIIAGRPSLEIKGTPIYFDVEGIPDQNFYYLIGYRFKKNSRFSQKSLWANCFASEKIIWHEFLENLSSIENPKLIHYGSYETGFLKQMKERYGEGSVNSDFLDCLITNSLNLLPIIYAQVYFPTYSNSLKDVAKHLGFNWSNNKASGTNVLLWRHKWELIRSASLRQRIITYNTEDCQALQKVTESVIQLCRMTENTGITNSNIVHADSMKLESPYRLQKNNFEISEYEYINRCAYWDYQRDKIYIRSSKRLKGISQKKQPKKSFPNKIIELPTPAKCPLCNSRVFYVHAKLNKIIYDLKFCRSGIKRWTIKYKFNRYVCKSCRKTFYSYKKNWKRSNYGRNLIIYAIYQNIELRLTQEKVINHINQLFSLNIPVGTFHHFKSKMSNYYIIIYKKLLTRRKSLI